MELNAAARNEIRANVFEGFRHYARQKGTDPIVVAKDRVAQLSNQKSAAARYRAEVWQGIIDGYNKENARQNDSHHISHGAI